MFRNDEQQAPQSVPARQLRAIAETLRAPFWMTSLILRSFTAWQTQTIMVGRSPSESSSLLFDTDSR